MWYHGMGTKREAECSGSEKKLLALGEDNILGVPAGRADPMKPMIAFAAGDRLRLHARLHSPPDVLRTFGNGGDVVMCAKLSDRGKHSTN